VEPFIFIYGTLGFRQLYFSVGSAESTLGNAKKQNPALFRRPAISASYSFKKKQLEISHVTGGVHQIVTMKLSHEQRSTTTRRKTVTQFQKDNGTRRKCPVEKCILRKSMSSGSQEILSKISARRCVDSRWRNGKTVFQEFHLILATYFPSPILCKH